jgi:hypothetical protein
LVASVGSYTICILYSYIVEEPLYLFASVVLIVWFKFEPVENKVPSWIYLFVYECLIWKPYQGSGVALFEFIILWWPSFWFGGYAVKLIVKWISRIKPLVKSNA